MSTQASRNKTNRNERNNSDWLNKVINDLTKNKIEAY